MNLLENYEIILIPILNTLRMDLEKGKNFCHNRNRNNIDITKSW